MPKPAALNLATKDGSIHKLLHGAVRSFSDSHPEWAIPGEARTSLVKRIEGSIRAEFARLLAERTILDWLEAHRGEWAELAMIPGGLRKVIVEEMEKRGDLDE
jgi:hypothetical protein